MVVNACTRVHVRWRRFKRTLMRHTAVVKRFTRLGRAFLGTPGQRSARWLLGVLLALCLAVGGLLGSRLAVPITVLVVLLTWFVQLLGPLLNLPDFIQQLALTNHIGQPMVGVWDWGGMASLTVIAVAGLALGTWGFKRRDLRG